MKLAYGRTGLEIDLPPETDVIRSRHVPGLDDEGAALQDALRRPYASEALASKIEPGDTVAITHSDITRPTPNDRILPLLLAELELAGIRPQDTTLINGVGTHRRQTENELRAMLGDAIVDRYRCLQHDPHDEGNLVSIGITSLGHPVRLNRRFLEADVRIITGLIEPHLFAGFSGGPKGVLPALAGAESVATNHGLKMIGSPHSSWGITRGNPIWEEMLEVALRANPTFLLNVTINSSGEITGVFAGDMLTAHAAGCEFLRASSMVAVDHPYDIVLTTNSGYPLDLNLYQSVKGISAAGQIVRDGGTIILATACEEGLPEHGQYARLLAGAGSPDELLAKLHQPGFRAQDQWQVQIQAQLQLRAQVYVYSDGLSDRELKGALLRPCRDIRATITHLQETLGRPAQIAALPEGPQTIAYVGG